MTTTIRAVSRSYPAVNVGGCSEPYVTGEMLTDGSVENPTVGGPGGAELPGINFDTIPSLHYSDGTAVDYAEFYTFFEAGPILNSQTVISETANPRTGTAHLRIGNLSTGTVFVARQGVCPPLTETFLTTNSHGPFYTARVAAGDTLSVSGWFQYVGGTLTEFWNVSVDVWIYDQTQDFVTVIGDSHNVPALNTWFEASYVASIPAGGYYAVVEFRANQNDETDFVDADDFSVVLS